MSKASKEYEQKTHAIFQKYHEQLGYTRVEGEKKYTGKRTGRKRQIDVTAHKPDGTIVPIECKLHKRRAGIEDLDKFNSVAHLELEADEGIVVSSSGFDAGAQAAARGYDLIMSTLNSAATVDDHNLKIIREHLGGINDHFWAVSNTVPISATCVWQNTPVESKDE